MNNQENGKRYLLESYYKLKKQLKQPDLSHQESFNRAYEMVEEAKSLHFYPFRRLVQSNSEINPDHPTRKQVAPKCMNLATNDYLNFRYHPEVIATSCEAIKELGVGSGSVPMFAGTQSVHIQLEKNLAEFLGMERCLLFSSGYSANAGALKVIIGQHDAVVLDTLVHASIIDGAGTSTKYFFLHNDMDSLDRALEKASKHENTIIVVEGLYSMDGDPGFLPGIIERAQHHEAILLIDDAHGIGVMGPKGRGTLAHFNLSPQHHILTGSFGKALAGIGGFVAGSKEVIQYLELMCWPFLYSSSIPPAVAAGIIKELELLENDDPAHRILWKNTRRLSTGLRSLGFNLGVSSSPIIPIIIKDDLRVLSLCANLEKRGIWVNPIIYPVVAKSRSRLRLSVTSALTDEDIDYVLNAFEAEKK